MRVLVACPDCQRKYDASKRKIGTRFRCLCGKLLTVQPPRGHEASVVRCSSCGSPREEGINRCAFCSADFTIHEQDLHTVCPECLTRVSDRARFCGHCGARLAAEMVAGELTEATCPCCEGDVPLASRQFGEARVSVLECPHCGGLWLGIDSFTILRDRALREPSDPGLAETGQPKLTAANPANPVRYRKCIICKEFMHRRQYGRGSGVVIDVCRSHGIWFDDGELQQVLEWIRLGGRTDRPVDADPEKEPTPARSPFASRRPMTREPRDFLENIFEGFFIQFGGFFD